MYRMQTKSFKNVFMTDKGGRSWYGGNMTRLNHNNRFNKGDIRYMKGTNTKHVLYVGVFKAAKARKINNIFTRRL